MENNQEPNDEELRNEVVRQLRESLSRSRKMMQNDSLDVKTRERWTQLHTNTAQVLNQVLENKQPKTGRKGSKNWKRPVVFLGESACQGPRRARTPSIHPAR